jgi:enoyl-CoA hydratase/carnithine racemase
MGDFIQFEKRGRIVILTLNRPDKLNDIGEESDCFDLIDSLTRIGRDADISAAILTGVRQVGRVEFNINSAATLVCARTGLHRRQACFAFTMSSATSTIMSSWPPTIRRRPSSTRISLVSTP